MTHKISHPSFGDFSLLSRENQPSDPGHWLATTPSPCVGGHRLHRAQVRVTDPDDRLFPFQRVLLRQRVCTVNPSPCEARDWRVFSIGRAASSTQRSSRTSNSESTFQQVSIQFQPHGPRPASPPAPHRRGSTPVPAEWPVPDAPEKRRQRYNHGMCGLPSFRGFTARQRHRPVWT